MDHFRAEGMALEGRLMPRSGVVESIAGLLVQPVEERPSGPPRSCTLTVSCLDGERRTPHPPPRRRSRGRSGSTRRTTRRPIGKPTPACLVSRESPLVAPIPRAPTPVGRPAAGGQSSAGAAALVRPHFRIIRDEGWFEAHREGDATAVRNLRRRQPEAEIDLHGCRVEEAQQRVVEFVRRSHHAGKRVIRIIHGKRLALTTRGRRPRRGRAVGVNRGNDRELGPGGGDVFAKVRRVGSLARAARRIVTDVGGQPRVRRAGLKDVAQLVDMLDAALADDPFVGWVTGGARLRRRRYVDLLVRHVAARGEVYVVDDLTSAALWIPPGGWNTGALEQVLLWPRLLRTVGVRRLGTVTERLRAIERERPPLPWYLLALLGTDPKFVGTGRATAALRPILDRCDRDRVVALVDTSHPDNQRFYRRFGFRPVSHVDLVPGVVSCWTMARPPRDTNTSEAG